LPAGGIDRAACTSCPAASISRARSNWIEITDGGELGYAGHLANCRSSGLATEEAIVSGLVPGNWAVT
jgi:hypothetical protein